MRHIHTHALALCLDRIEIVYVNLQKKNVQRFGTMVVVHSNNFEKCVSDVKLHVLFHSQFLRAFFPTFDSVYCALNRLNEMNLFVKFVVYALNMCVRALNGIHAHLFKLQLGQNVWS